MAYNKWMELIHALRFTPPSTGGQTISLVGAGGKTTAMFKLARQFTNHCTVVTAASSHMGVWQLPLADHHIIAASRIDMNTFPKKSITLVTGAIENDRTKPIDNDILKWLHESAKERSIPLLIEADGSRQKPIKSPAEHEPSIPDYSDVVVVVAGLSIIGKTLTDEHVHRPEMFSKVSGLCLNQPITPKQIITALTHPQGGLKNIPHNARRIAILNQADTINLQSLGGEIAQGLLGTFDSVIVGSLQNDFLRTVEYTAGIILAAGQATRYGSPKQLLDWKGKPFVRYIAETALHSGLWPVVVVTGFHSADIESSLKDLPVQIVYNPDYKQGQSSSIKTGIASLPQNVGSALFLLADQPQIPGEVIRALVESHTKELQPIIAPLVLEERRANPVLFDRITFPYLLQLEGDEGGRALFSKFKVEYIPWHDDLLLLDVDNPEDYQRLVNIENF